MGKGPSPLGLDWLKKIKLNWAAIFQVRTEGLSELLRKYDNVFRDKLDKIKGLQAKIYMDPEAAPQFFRARLVPYALCEKVDAELKRLEELGIIQPLQFSELAAPIISILKPDKTIRICSDYKQTVNQATKLDNKAVLRHTHSIEETGEIVWYLALCLFLAWLITGLALCQGIRSSGKVVYFTATLPYLLIFLLIVRGATLEGAKNGIEYYIGRQSDFSKLAQVEVWKDAATQMFYSIAVALRAITALSSYNRFNNDCYRDAILVSVVNCGTSVFAGFAIFTILGHMVHLQGKPVQEVVEHGFGLVFIAYPDALALLPVSPLWSIIFFLMLITLGIDSQFAMMETITTSITDALPDFMQSKYLYMIIVLCLSFYSFGLVFVTQTDSIRLLGNFLKLKQTIHSSSVEFDPEVAFDYISAALTTFTAKGDSSIVVKLLDC
ncbi:sodium- and chloride-dependent neutral and basic amino acid transporter B(0+)-like [Cetorhinus maximus]